MRWRKQLGGLVSTAYIPTVLTLVRARWLVSSIWRRGAGKRSFFGGWVGSTERAIGDVDGESGWWLGN